MRFDQVVGEKSEDDGSVCDAIVSEKGGSSWFGWVGHASMRETDELLGDDIRDIVPPGHASDCIER